MKPRQHIFVFLPVTNPFYTGSMAVLRVLFGLMGKGELSLSDDKQADVIDALNTTSRYLDGILDINNVYFDNMVSQIYPSELQLNKPIPLKPKPHF